MAIIAGFLSQNVLKYLLGFGEVCPFLGYNAQSDFFPRYEMLANVDCSDLDCRRLQDHYKINADSARLPALKKKQKTPEQTIPSENDWGIEIVPQESSEANITIVEE
jgi:ubiquitin-like modifier-activating enzyme 5